MESVDFSRLEHYQKSDQLYCDEAFQCSQGLADGSFSNSLYALTANMPIPKPPATDQPSLTPPTNRLLRKSKLHSTSKRNHLSSRTSSPIYKKRTNPDRLSLRCSSPSYSELSQPDVSQHFPCESFCNDSECEIPPCSEPGCDWNDVIVCSNGNDCDVSAACMKDCFSLHSRQNTPSEDWIACEMINTENFPSRQIYADTLASYLESSASPSSTPLLSNYPSTIFSQAELSTPKGTFSPLDSFKDQSDLSSSNIKAQFPQGPSTCNMLEQSWCSTEQFPKSNDKMFVFQCPWLNCSRIIKNNEQWNQHFHQEHVDPQMVYNCPLQADTCPETMTTNPLIHLQTDHGYNFNSNGNGYRCPSEDCQQGMELFDPLSFHNHLDSFHATPGAGQLECRLWACGNMFDHPNDLISHAMQNHTIPVWSKPEQDQTSCLGPPDFPAEDQSQMNQISQNAQDDKSLKSKKEILQPKHSLRSQDDSPSSTKYSVVKSTSGSGKNAVHSCKWKILQEDVCGLRFVTENDLHNHIKDTHLESLDNKTGYYCRWDGCTRESKLGEKSGFSQRGKLERHMATHTNSPQAMKQHRRLHTGERPWKCQHCDKTFTQQSACTVHERTHTNEKPLECPICSKKFSESSNLTKHRKTHGEKGAHACTFPNCDKTFHRYDQLKRHLSAHSKHLTSANSTEKRDK